MPLTEEDKQDVKDRIVKNAETHNHDMEILRLLAQSVAEETVHKLREDVREDIRNELHAQIKTEIARYFGETSPSQHVLQHSRMERFLAKLDSLSDNFWGTIVKGVVNWGLTLFLLGYLVWITLGEGKIG